MRDLEEYRQAIENNKATVKTLGYKIEELGRQTAVLENALRSLRTDAQRLARL
jgi:multidrug resistance efflux pump